jgi:hypothetical protein
MDVLSFAILNFEGATVGWSSVATRVRLVIPTPIRFAVSPAWYRAVRTALGRSPGLGAAMPAFCREDLGVENSGLKTEWLVAIFWASEA